MTVAGLAAIAVALGVASLGARRWPAGPWIIGLAGSGILLIGAWALPLGVRAQIGNETFQSTGYLRLVLMLLAAGGGALTFIGGAVGGPRSLPALLFAWFGLTTTALAMVSPVPAIFLLTMGSLAVIMIAVEAGGAEQAMVAARGLRAIVVAGLIAAFAISWANVAGTSLRAGLGDGGAAPDGGAVGLAFVAGAVAVALRGGAIPLHVWSSRLTNSLPPLATPVTFVWGPAALAVVILGWSEPAIHELGQQLDMERMVVGLIAMASIIFGALAAFLHDDLEHVVGYSLVSDTGVVLLAVAAADPEAWGPARMWILAYLVAKTAFVAWSVAMRSTFGTSQISELSGWARRSPLLAGGLIIVGLVAVGVPGLASFEARARVIGLALDPPLDTVAWLGVVAAAGYSLRLLVAGFREPAAAVALATNVAPGWPGGRPARLSPALARQLPGAWAINRAPAAAGAALALAVLGLAVAAGGFHAPSISAAPPPAAGGPADVMPTASPSPTAPRPSSRPATSPLPGLPG